MEENANKWHSLIAFNFVIHPQILIFLVFKIATFFFTDEKVFSVASPDNRQMTASTHPVTQGSAALSLSACCVVARRSASR